MKKSLLLIISFFMFSSIVNASYVLIDKDTNRVLLSNNKDEKKLIASITKVMTAYIVIKNVSNLNDEITLTKDHINSHGSMIYLSDGEKLKVIDLLYGLLLRSGNDAATALAIYTSGSIDEFVKLMNYEAKNIGMLNTHFENPTGLDDENTKNISTAYDMAILTSKAMENKEFRKIFKTKKYKCKSNLKSFSWTNKNKTLFMDKHINGGKTGYTKKSRRTLITSYKKDNVNLIMVTLNHNDDFNFHVNSYKNIINSYNKYLIINKNNLNIDDTYYKKKYNVKFYTNNNYHLLLKNNEFKNISIIYTLFKNKNIRNNSVVGYLKVYSKNKPIHEDAIYISVK